MEEQFLKNKVAVVSGGARGIGRAIVKKLAQQGCHVTFNYLVSEQLAKDLEKEVLNTGVRCRAVKVDVKDFAGVKAWMDQIERDWEKIDILINNAGIIADKALMMMSQQDWKSVIDTNLNGMFHMARSCIVKFMKQRRGDIVNISSVSGLIGLPRQTNYSATKGAMNAFTKALAKEVAGYGVRVNAVAPGFIETDILAGLSDEFRQEILKTIPLGRIGDVEDVANCVKFLLSPAAAYLTGQIIQVDGGLAIR